MALEKIKNKKLFLFKKKQRKMGIYLQQLNLKKSLNILLKIKETIIFTVRFKNQEINKVGKFFLIHKFF